MKLLKTIQVLATAPRTLHSCLVQHRTLMTKSPVALATRSIRASPSVVKETSVAKERASYGELKIIKPLQEEDFFQLNQMVKLDELFK